MCVERIQRSKVCVGIQMMTDDCLDGGQKSKSTILECYEDGDKKLVSLSGRHCYFLAKYLLVTQARQLLPQVLSSRKA